jgi:hypothetical protein
MVVLDLAVITIPVAFMEAFSIMPGFYPACAVVRWTRPVSIVPFIVVAHRVPVASDPGIVRPGASGLNPEYTYRWRRADSHANGKLSENRSSREQHQNHQFSLHDLTPFLSITLVPKIILGKFFANALGSLAACLKLLTLARRFIRRVLRASGLKRSSCQARW